MKCADFSPHWVCPMKSLLFYTKWFYFIPGTLAEQLGFDIQDVEHR